VCLDLHGAIHGHLDDGEGELLARVRRIVGRVPVMASLDLHANVTRAMMTPPMVSMPRTIARRHGRHRPLERTLKQGSQARAMRPLDFLTACVTSPRSSNRAPALRTAGQAGARPHAAGFPMAVSECQMAVLTADQARVQKAVDAGQR
jgi:hypothetical protein